jgi:tetratricopeptide (TPR) repeat protein
LCAGKTLTRNADWKNHETLFAQALTVSPNSVLVNNNVAWALMKQALAETDTSRKNALLVRSVALLHKAVTIYPDYASAYINASIAYLHLVQPDSAIANLAQARRLYPSHPRLPELFYSAGVIYYQRHRGQQAADAWQATLQLQPGFAPARQALNALIGK